MHAVRGMLFLFNRWSRFVTHTGYWQWHPTFDQDGVAAHIGHLRNAVALDDN